MLHETPSVMNIYSSIRYRKAPATIHFNMSNGSRSAERGIRLFLVFCSMNMLKSIEKAVELVGQLMAWIEIDHRLRLLM